MVEKIGFFLFCFGFFCCHFKILFTQLFNLHQKIDYSCVRLFDTCVHRQRSQGPTYNTLYFLFSSKFNVRINWNNLNLDFLAHLVSFFFSLYMCAEHTEIQRKNEIIFNVWISPSLTGIFVPTWLDRLKSRMHLSHAFISKTEYSNKRNWFLKCRNPYVSHVTICTYIIFIT